MFNNDFRFNVLLQQYQLPIKFHCLSSYVTEYLLHLEFVCLPIKNNFKAVELYARADTFSNRDIMYYFQLN